MLTSVLIPFAPSIPFHSSSSLSCWVPLEADFYGLHHQGSLLISLPVAPITNDHTDFQLKSTLAYSLMVLEVRSPK